LSASSQNAKATVTPPHFPQALPADVLLAAIVACSDDAICSKTLDGVITSWNRAAERLFGYTTAEAVGRHVAMLAAPGREEEMPRILAQIRRGEKIDHYDTLRRRKDGSIIEISLTVSPIRDSTGRIVGASKIARDISERKRWERRGAAAEGAQSPRQEHARGHPVDRPQHRAAGRRDRPVRRHLRRPAARHGRRS
jgi:PAS domain S-box-containing protein